MLNVAIAGLGTVGSEVLRLLVHRGHLLAARAGKPITVVAVSARDRRRDRGVPLDGIRWFDDPVEMAERADVNVIVELIGGADGVAKRTCESAVRAGHHVVTANKALIATHGSALAHVAEERSVALRFEAAVAGGIPVIKAIREGLAANRLSRVSGILNGTCNYLLTQMAATHRPFADVLAEAQRLGYAEANPDVDVDGTDTAHKLAILAALAFETEPNFNGVHVEGIRRITPLDLTFAEQLGYRVKLLGTAWRATDGSIAQHVHPCLVPITAPIAAVDGVRNAVVITGDAAGSVMLEGRGAGAGSTASAVIADLVDLARGYRSDRECAFGIPARELESARTLHVAAHIGPSYVRLVVHDAPGAIASVAAALAHEHISIASLLQQRRGGLGSTVPVVLTTHDAQEDAMQRALAHIAELHDVTEPPCHIRIESATTEEIP